MTLEKTSDNFESDSSSPDPPRRQSSRYRLQSSAVVGRHELTQEDAYEVTAFSFSPWKKWRIMAIIFVLQTSLNVNASLYSNGTAGIAAKYDVSAQAARVGQAVFLICYAFGCELWAPWSEEFGRKPILQGSLFLVSIWQIPCALAPNFATLVVGRALAGLSSAGGSVTIAMVADMWQSDEQQFAVGFIGFSSLGGGILGPIIGGFVEQYLSLPWIFWIQLILSVFSQVIHLIFVPETRFSVLLDREAKHQRTIREDANIYGPGELSDDKMSVQEILRIWSRPFVMLIQEPVVLCLSLLSGFSDALIFTFLESYSLVFKQWSFTPSQIGLLFIAIGLGYLLGYMSFWPDFAAQNKMRRNRSPNAVAPERRLKLLLFLAPLETIGLFGFAWTSSGPPMPWIVPNIFTCLVGIGNFAIYMASVDYMMAAYGPYSASAVGGNGFARDFLSGIATMYAAPMYEDIGALHLQWASTLLGCLAIIITIPIYIFYFYGPEVRSRSRFANELAADKLKRRARQAAT